MVAAPPTTLEGLTIGITADRRADEQAQMLTSRGARVLHGPVIRTMSVADPESARRATEELLRAPPDIVVANTGLGMRTWLALADDWGLADRLLNAMSSAHVVARGPKAVASLGSFGVDVDWRSPSSTLAEVVEHLLARSGGVAAARIALQLDGSGGADAVIDALQHAGADVVTVPTYRWTMPRDPAPALRLIEAACAERLDAVTFTAAPAVHNLFALAGQEGVAGSLRAALSGPVLTMCVGPVCREAATAHGVVGSRVPPTARLGTMVKELADELQHRRRVVAVDSVRVEIQGGMVRVGDRSVVLAGRERELFSALSRKPGVVVPRSALLGEVWGARDADGHVLEVAVGRLRRKLAPTRLTVEAVMRRGYRLAAA